MKHLLLTIIAAVVLVGCGESQQSAPAPEAKPEPPTAKPDISIHLAVNRGNIEAVKQHLAAGTDVDVKTKAFGWTPLHRAAIRDRKEIAELLIANGADVNAKSKDGRTPLHYATSAGHKEIVELLLANGADVNAKDEDGWTPLDRANRIGRPETTDLLRKHGGKTGEELKAEGK